MAVSVPGSSPPPSSSSSPSIPVESRSLTDIIFSFTQSIIPPIFKLFILHEAQALVHDRLFAIAARFSGCLTRSEPFRVESGAPKRSGFVTPGQRPRCYTQVGRIQKMRAMLLLRPFSLAQAFHTWEEGSPHQRFFHSGPVHGAVRARDAGRIVNGRRLKAAGTRKRNGGWPSYPGVKRLG